MRGGCSLIPHLAQTRGQVRPGAVGQQERALDQGILARKSRGRSQPCLGMPAWGWISPAWARTLPREEEGKSPNSSGCSILSSANEAWMGPRCFAGHYPKLT